MTAPAKLAYAENTIRRPRSSENASWQRDNEPLPARKPYRGVERDRSMRISISFRSQDRWKIRDLEHDGCKTVSSLWIIWLFETWWIYRAFFSRWMEFHVECFVEIICESWICNVKKFLKLVYIYWSNMWPRVWWSLTNSVGWNILLQIGLLGFVICGFVFFCLLKFSKVHLIIYSKKVFENFNQPRKRWIIFLFRSRWIIYIARRFFYLKFEIRDF